MTVLLFAGLREVVGHGRVELELPDGADAAAAFSALEAAAPRLSGFRPRVRCALGDEYVAWETVLTDGAELALIPPTSGG